MNQTTQDPWQPYDAAKHIHPIPEPRVYCALFVFVCMLFVVWRKIKNNQ